VLLAVAAACAVRALAATVSPFAAGERVTFFGDSITHGGSYHVDLQLYWDLRHPGSGTRLMNCGGSGDSASSGVNRWPWDALPQRADRTFVMFGMNDVGRSDYDVADLTAETISRRARSIANYSTNMAAVAACVRKAGQKLVIMTPTPYDEYGTNYTCAASVGCNEPGLAACASVGRALAAQLGAEVVELHRPLTEFVRRQDGYCFCSAKDRTHPRADGHLIIMAEVLKAMGEPSDFGGADVDALGKAEVSFRYDPGALPFPVAEDYLKAEKVYPLTDSFNREMLTVRNLPAGRYRLTADGAPLGEFSDTELLAGVNLALLPTPGAKRAREAWDVSRELLSAQEKLRGLVFVEVNAAHRGARRDDFNDVCEKLEALVAKLRAEKRPWAPYFADQLAMYREAKPRENEIKAEEERARTALAELGRKPAAYTLCVSAVK